MHVIMENWIFLVSLLTPFTSGADDENDPHLNMEPTEESVKRAMNVRLKPYFDSLPQAKREKLKAALDEALRDDSTNWEGVWECNMPPFDCPAQPRYLFVWIWQVLFPDEAVPHPVANK
jgi:hypothetical protein